jgi:hypothetical protein
MPYKTQKVRGKRNCYRVLNTRSKHAFSKCTTRKNAKKQMKLLRAIQFNKNFVPNSKTRKQQTRKI